MIWIYFFYFIDIRIKSHPLDIGIRKGSIKHKEKLSVYDLFNLRQHLIDGSGQGTGSIVDIGHYCNDIAFIQINIQI